MLPHRLLILDLVAIHLFVEKMGGWPGPFVRGVFNREEERFLDFRSILLQTSMTANVSDIFIAMIIESKLVERIRIGNYWAAGISSARTLEIIGREALSNHVAGAWALTDRRPTDFNVVVGHSTRDDSHFVDLSRMKV